MLQDPLFNEFVFDVIVHSTAKERTKLSNKEKRNLRSATTTKHFVNKTTIDEKLILLQKLGVSYAVVIQRVKTLMPHQLKKMYKDHKSELTEETISDLLQTKLFVMTDKRVSYFLNLMDAACHSETYMLNRDFYLIGNEMNYKDSPYPSNIEINEGLQHQRVINKFLLSGFNALRDVQGNTKIGDLDLKILMYLFLKKDRYMYRTDLNKYFRYQYKMTILAAALKRLQIAAHIDASPHFDKVPSYMITSTGIDVVLSFIRKVMTDTLEY